jgi:hypothetical protein
MRRKFLREGVGEQTERWESGVSKRERRMKEKVRSPRDGREDEKLWSAGSRASWRR